jgi:hypothetical protein
MEEQMFAKKKGMMEITGEAKKELEGGLWEVVSHAEN